MIILSANFMVGCSERTGDGELKDILSKRIPSLEITAVTPSEINGLYEVVANNSHIFYSDAKGKFVVLGEMMNAENQENLTSRKLSEINRISYADLPFQYALKQVNGNGLREISVFSDPNCPYCHKLEAELNKLRDTTIYTFIYPVLTPDSPIKARHILCSSNPEAAWKRWMEDKIPPSQDVNCSEDAVNKLIDLGKTLRVNGTPTIFFKNGLRGEGILTAEDIENKLNG